MSDMDAGREMDALVAERVWHCRSCNGVEFKWRKGGPTGRFRICPPCTLAKRRAYYARTADAQRASRRERAKVKRPSPQFKEYQWRHKLKSRYGLTPAQYMEMLMEQTGRCAICACEMRSEPHVDHTGAVRGLLCHRCNPEIAMFDDSPERMEAAAKYLRGAR